MVFRAFVECGAKTPKKLVNKEMLKTAALKPRIRMNSGRASVSESLDMHLEKP